MISGMTGFARAEGGHASARWTWELRSVNGRSLDLKLKLAPGLEHLEAQARDLIAAQARRGSILAALAFERAETPARLEINHELLSRLIDAAEPYIAAGRVARPSWEGLLNVKGVLAFQNDLGDPSSDEQADLDKAVLASLETAARALKSARLSEGAALSAALHARVDLISDLVQKARQEADGAPGELAAKLRTRAQALAGDIPIDPARLAQEAALLASKADIAEELDRLDAHVMEARALLRLEEAVGRKLDFLSQEFNREANTLCSKAGSGALTKIGLDLKHVIEQFREQAANVE